VKDKYEDASAVDVRKWACDEFGLDLALETDSRAALLGEWRYGAGRDHRNIVMMTLGTAIGVAVLMQGKLLRGVHFQAGLGGHLIVNPGGRPCNCGGRGCLTAEASTWALPSIVRTHPAYAESALAQEHSIDYEAVFRLAARGDSLARKVRDHSLDLWSMAVVSLIHVFDPEMIILGGGILHSADIIVPHVQTYIDRYAWTPWGHVEVRCAAYLAEAALLGVGFLAHQGVEAL
jgi:glucokinase